MWEEKRSIWPKAARREADVGVMMGDYGQLAANCSNKVFKSPARAIALRQFSGTAARIMSNDSATKGLNFHRRRHEAG